MRIQALCEAAKIELRWRPFLLGPIFELQGWNDSPFNLNDRRGRYMWRDLERLAAKFDLPWRRPTRFPRASTLPGRVGCLAADEPWCGDYVRRVFAANFGEDREIGEPDVLSGLLDGLGLPGAAVIERALAPQHRGLLRANTEHATQLGIFGAPNCVVADELFWGEESLEDAIAWAARATRT